MMPARIVRAVAVASLLASAGCMPPQEGAHTESRVWSTANSQDGYAKCPQGTTVTGGGFEIKEADLTAGHVPLVTARRV